MGAEGPLDGMDFWSVALEAKAGDMCLLKGISPESLVECAMCTRGDKDCLHLLFECQLTQAIWISQKTSRIDVTSKEALWGSLTSVACMLEAEEERLLAVL